jgi:PST family polysaccharide transporter
MITKIRQTLDSGDNRILFSNFFSLTLLQAVNYILPLITLPYLVRVIGVENFGLLAFSVAVIGYFQIVTDYGFNLSATKEISIHRENKDKINEIFSSVMTIKIILGLLGFVMMSILVFSFKKFSTNWGIYLLTYGTVLGQVLFPVWFFQGMEKMKHVTILNILAKSIFTITIFLFIKKANDFYFVPILTSSGFLIVGIISLIIIKKRFHVNFILQPTEKFIFYLKDGWHIFVSIFATSLYTMSTVMLIGLFTNNIIVGYYSAAEKLINAIKGLISPVSQTLFPYISRKAHISKQIALRTIRKITTITGTLMFVISVLLLLFSKSIISIVLGPEYMNSLIVFRIFSIVPFLVSLDTMFGTLTMLVFNRNRQYSRIIISAGIINIILSCILIPLFQHIGAAISVLVVELFITLNVFGYVQYNDLKIFEKSPNG